MPLWVYSFSGADKKQVIPADRHCKHGMAHSVAACRCTISPKDESGYISKSKSAFNSPFSLFFVQNFTHEHISRYHHGK